MYKFTTLYINSVSLIISVIIFFTGNFIYENYENITKKSSLKTGFLVNTEETKDTNENNMKNNLESKTEKNKEDVEIKDWYIEIPKINLKAPIEEGTSSKILESYVGHFSDTSKKDGTIGLARS